MHDRAAQFAPFAALVGYDDAVAETARLTEARPELDEQEQRELNARLCELADHIQDQPEVRIKYFVPDERKSGGAIIEICGAVKKTGGCRWNHCPYRWNSDPHFGYCRASGYMMVATMVFEPMSLRTIKL